MSQKSKITKADESLFTGPYFEIKTADQLQALCKAASDTFDLFESEIAERMTPERSKRIRELRVDECWSWRGVAQECFNEWGKDATWSPPSNQLAGMALCKLAAIAHGEDYYDEGTWN